jgi:hypothetical protein
MQRLTSIGLIAVVWASLALSVVAQSGPRPGSTPAERDTTGRMAGSGQPVGSPASPDTVYVASGDVWAGTLQAQVRQRALFRQMRRDPSGDGSDTPDGTRQAQEGLSIGGLVINDTRTTIGSDFYDGFYSRWETPKGAGNVTVRVREQPRPNLGTRIVVEVEDQSVFRANLRPRLDQIQRAARGALARVHRYIRERYEPRSRY